MRALELCLGINLRVAQVESFVKLLSCNHFLERSKERGLLD